MVERFLKYKSFLCPNTKSYFYTSSKKWDILGHDLPQISYQCDCIIAIIDEASTSAPTCANVITSHTYPNIQPFLSSITMVLPCATLRNSAINVCCLRILIWIWKGSYFLFKLFNLKTNNIKNGSKSHGPCIHFAAVNTDSMFRKHYYLIHLNIWIFYHTNFLNIWIVISSHTSQLIVLFCGLIPKNSLLVLKEGTKSTQPISM